MTLAFDFYFSFRSPYSYLAVPQITEALERYDLSVRMRIVYPIAVRIPGFFKRVDPLWPPYLMRDTRRIADMRGIPYRWPRPLCWPTPTRSRINCAPPMAESPNW